MVVTYVSRDEALAAVAEKIPNVEVVLDLGPGIHPQPFIKNPCVHICVEAHRPYVERLKREVRDDPTYVFINARWNEALATFPDKSVDTVFALDFIEHLEKEDGRRLLSETQRVARRQVVIFTPYGFFPQTYDDPNKSDRWGMDGGYWQTHRSGWDFDDFSDEWEIVCCPTFIDLDENEQRLPQPMGAFWAIRNFGAAEERHNDVVKDKSAWVLFKKALQQGLPPLAFNGMRRVWHSLRRNV
jgi:hypothetical protein